MTQRLETYSLNDLEKLVDKLGQPRFRALQIFEWVWGKGVASYEDMTNLPASLRAQLAVELPFVRPAVLNKQVSADGTRKYVLKLADGALVETVGIPAREQTKRDLGHGLPNRNAAGLDVQNNSDLRQRLTVCFSTQVGCPMKCDFCATGKEGFTRNLEPGEMVWQIITVAQDFGMRVSNAVAMGQGEPFLNYSNLLAALRILNHPKGPGIGARHITVSTCGLPDGMIAFGNEPEQFTLALSLHAARQSVRDRLMPGIAQIPLTQVHEAIVTYCMRSSRRISLEYLLIRDINDSDDDFQALVDFCHGLNCHVNLLPINPVDKSPYQPCSRATMQSWLQKLTEAHIQASVRDSRGDDIHAACGQLKNAQN